MKVRKDVREKKKRKGLCTGKRRKWVREQKGRHRQPVGKFIRGKPLEGGRVITKARERGVYGCGRKRAKRRCRIEGVSERAVRGRVGEERRVGMEKWSKGKRVMGSERQRMENERRQRERKRGTVRGKRRARGLPVRGQRTSTNGKTARKRNRKRG